MATKDLVTVKPNEWKLATIKPEKMVSALQAMSGPEGFNPFELPRLTVPGGGGLAWEIQTGSGSEPHKTFNAVIVHHHDARKFWDEAFGLGERKPPTCQSYDGIQGFGSPGGVCRLCLLNASQACKPGMMMYLLRPDMVLPTVLWVPVMSLKGIKQYLIQGLAAYGECSFDVVTRFGLAKRQSRGGIAYSAITADRVDVVPNEMMSIVASFREHFVPFLAQAFEALAMTVSDSDPVLMSTPSPDPTADLWGGAVEGRVVSENHPLSTTDAGVPTGASHVPDDDEDIPDPPSREA
jgi:hypothetical protein